MTRTLNRKYFNATTPFEKVLLFFNCLAAFALLISYLAPYTNPASFWPIAFFSMAYVPILLTNIVFLVFWLLRLNVFALISGVCILLGFNLLLHNIGFHKPGFGPTKASPGYIRMMTYNVYDFLNEQDDDHSSTNSQILQIIKEQQPDIINMQEYFTHNSDKAAMANSIQKVLRTNYYYFKPVKTTPYDSTGLAIFSRFPIINRDTIPVTIDGVETEGIFVDLKRDNKVFRVYCVHLQSTHFSRTDNAYLDKLSHNGKPSLHESKLIGGKLKLAFIRRGQQVLAIKQQMERCPYPYIITGDFNDTPLSFAVNQMAKGLKNAFVEKGSGLGVTYYGQFPGFQLDYIMVNPQFNVINYQIIKQKLSDHYPVFSDLQLK
jgi:endonuclease/exonuclease/phosphatase family metal-dependent hydrolase